MRARVGRGDRFLLGRRKATGVTQPSKEHVGVKQHPHEPRLSQSSAGTAGSVTSPTTVTVPASSN